LIPYLLEVTAIATTKSTINPSNITKFVPVSPKKYVAIIELI